MLEKHISMAMGALLLGILVSGDCAAAKATKSPARNADDSAARCAGLSGKVISPNNISESSGGAVVISARFHLAGPIRPQGGDQGANYFAPDFCEVLFDILPHDPQAPVIHSQVNMPVAWNAICGRPFGCKR